MCKVVTVVTFCRWDNWGTQAKLHGYSHIICQGWTRFHPSSPSPDLEELLKLFSKYMLLISVLQDHSKISLSQFFWSWTWTDDLLWPMKWEHKSCSWLHCGSLRVCQQFATCSSHCGHGNSISQGLWGAVIEQSCPADPSVDLRHWNLGTACYCGITQPFLTDTLLYMLN